MCVWLLLDSPSKQFSMENASEVNWKSHETKIQLNSIFIEWNLNYRFCVDHRVAEMAMEISDFCWQ